MSGATLSRTGVGTGSAAQRHTAAALASPRPAIRATFLMAVALVCGGGFYYIGYRILTGVHPAEDAYILFKYAENLASGHGIVFNAGGPRAEGATDFLWLLLIAAGVRLGGDVALVALALNATGAALAGGLLARTCWGPPERPYWARLLLCAVLPATCLGGAALGGYWGFSTMLYAALILLLLVMGVEGRGRTLLALPIAGLVVALFRPDGVIVGASAAALGLWRARHEGLARSYLAVAAGCAVAGLAYFSWRWAYFGLPLPLPLYVKRNAPESAGGLLGAMPGIPTHWEWLVDGTGPLYIMAALASTLVATGAWREAAVRRTLVFLLPVGALLLALAFAVQTQNISWRFQAPAYLVLIYALLRAGASTIDGGRQLLFRIAVAGLAALVVLPSTYAGMREIRMHHNGRWRTYLETFAPEFGPVMHAGTVVALTEAGALPYWTQAQVADLVGLNLPDAATRPPTVETLAALDPDMVFLHQGTSLMTDVLVDADAGDERILPISPERLGQALRPSRRAIVERNPASYEDITLLNVQYAPSVMVAYLSQRSDYDIFIVDLTNQRTWLHVYGLKKDWPLRDHALEVLRRSMQPGSYRSYLEIRRQGPAAPPVPWGHSSARLPPDAHARNTPEGHRHADAP